MTLKCNLYQCHFLCPSFDGGVFVCSGTGSTSPSPPMASSMVPADGAPSSGSNGDTARLPWYGFRQAWNDEDFARWWKKNDLHHEQWSQKDNDDDDMSWDEESEKIDQQMALFWTSENESRLRNAYMTPYESGRVQGKADDKNEKGHKAWGKVVSHFGQPAGLKVGKHLLQHQALEAGMDPGQYVLLESVNFTLCKHLFYGSVKDMKNPKGRAAPWSVEGRALCYCFPETSMQPMGCIHKQKAIYLCNTFSQTLCATCSICRRCKKLLSWNTHCMLYMAALKQQMFLKFQKPLIQSHQC